MASSPGDQAVNMGPPPLDPRSGNGGKATRPQQSLRTGRYLAQAWGARKVRGLRRYYHVRTIWIAQAERK